MADAVTSPLDQGESPPLISVAPTLDYDSLGRSNLGHAFKRILATVPFPAISLILWFFNMFTYMWDRGPQLCNVTSYCDELMSLPILLAPLTAIYIVLSLFILDHLLALSPTFNGSTISTRTESSNEAGAATVESEGQTPSNSDASGGNGGRSWAAVVLRTLTIAAYALGITWAAASLVAIANVSLLIHLDFPDRSDNGKYTQRVYFGCGEAAFDAVLAHLMCRTATLCSKARQASIAEVQTPSATDTQEDASTGAYLSGVLQGIRSVSLSDLWHQRRTHYAMVVQGVANVRARLSCTLKEIKNFSLGDLWNKRTTLGQTILLLLASFTLSLFSFIFYAVVTSLSRFRLYNEAANYDLACLLAFLFTWLSLFKFHSCRSAGVRPGRIVRILTPGVAFSLAVYWVYGACAFIVASVSSLLCVPGPPDSPIPPDRPPCMKVGLSAALDGIVAGLLGLILAWSLGGVAVVAWRAGAGIQLGGGDAREHPNVDTADGLV